MEKQHKYALQVRWTGNTGQGTCHYRAYERSHLVLIEGKPDLLCSSDAAFRGDKSKHTPEDLFVAALSSCHMLWFLHLCCNAGVVIIDYVDNALGTMVETSNGGGHFTEVVLSPVVTVSDAAMIEKTGELHKKANELCFIAQSVNFPVHHKPVSGVKAR